MIRRISIRRVDGTKMVSAEICESSHIIISEKHDIAAGAKVFVYFKDIRSTWYGTVVKCLDTYQPPKQQRHYLLSMEAQTHEYFSEKRANQGSVDTHT